MRTRINHKGFNTYKANPHSKTVKGRSLTIKEIYERHKNGLNIPTKDEYYEENVDFDMLSNAEFNTMDIAEQHQYLLEQQRMLQQEIDNTKRKKDEIEALKKKSEEEKKALEVRQDKDPVN